MTEHKLEKYLKKTFNPPIGPSRLVPVVLSDSKARYLQSECKLSPEVDIKWWFKSGQKSTDGLAWLKDNLASKIGHLDNKQIHQPKIDLLSTSDYPAPMVDLATSRKAAIEKFKMQAKS